MFKSIILTLFVTCLQFNSAQAATKIFTPAIFSHWLDAAYIAAATYESTDYLQQTLTRQGYVITHAKSIEGYSVSYVLATNDKTKQHIIAVRGTSNVENILVDAAFVLVPDKLSGIKIHQGFLLSATEIYHQVKPKIMKGYKINTVGHSLGGATAIILAMMFDAQNFTVGEVITFGQPKVTNISGSQKFKHLDVIRLVTPKDLVPLVPPFDPMDLMNLSIFWHLGTEIILYAGNRYSVLSGISSMTRAADFLNDIPSEEHLNNHFMSTYINYLKPKVFAAEQLEYKRDFKISDWFATPAN